MVITTNKILEPLDCSKNSKRGLDMAIHIARQSQGTITALALKSVPGIYAIHPLGFLDFKSATAMKRIRLDAILGAATIESTSIGKEISRDHGNDIDR